MKSFFASVGREFRLIFRNGISIFMVAAPAILAFVFILVFGAVNQTTLQLAVDSSISEAEQTKLERIASVERFDNAESMQARIRETDAVIQVVRCFENPDIIHEMGSVDPLRDADECRGRAGPVRAVGSTRQPGHGGADGRCLGQARRWPHPPR